VSNAERFRRLTSRSVLWVGAILTTASLGG
jgi:hypothetical protein